MVRRGFTFVELLIVMALTTLLLSMLGPALAQSRQVARTVQCMNNLRQIGFLHMDPLRAGDRWGWSAYDLANARNIGTQGPTLHAQPRRANGNSGSVHNEIINIEWLEMQAPDMPSRWTLTCPVAVDTGKNSYGMNFRVVHGFHTTFSTSRDIIFGGSDFKIVDVARNFAFRHHDRSTLYYGDHHVLAATKAMFTQEQWSEKSYR